MKKLGRFLLIEGILSIGLAFLMYYVIGLSSAMELLYKPFDWIGGGLRWLSLSSSIGNIFAFICYVTLSLVPILYLLIRRRKAGLKKIDLLLPVISIYTFYMLYQFINTGLMLERVPQLLSDPSVLPMIKLAFAIVLYSILLCYLIIRMSETLEIDNTEERLQYLCRRLQGILLLVSVLYTFVIGYFSTFGMLGGIHKYAAKESSNPLLSNFMTYQSSPLPNQFIVILTYVMQCLPVIYVIYILIAGIELLKAMTSHHLEEEEYVAATRLSSIGKRAVYITVLSNLVLNIAQFLLSAKLNDASFDLNITLSPLIIAFSAMILSGYFKETKELHEDNEMII